jgi:hypothetical protein
MKKFRIYIAVLCTMLVAAACTNEMETETTTATDVAQLVKIGGFPAFDETAQTRTIGTPDEGKIEWATGDEVLLKIQLKNTDDSDAGTATTYTLTCNSDGSTWTASPALKLTLTDYRQKADITAYYAPAYQWSTTSTGTLALKSDKKAGTDEYLVYNATDVSLSDGISIDFSQKAREYSRLRVAAAPDMTVTLTSAAFTTNGDKTATATDGIIATADAKGNAYFYGKWTENATLTVALKEDATTFPTVSRTVAAASAAGSSYALDGFASLTAYGTIGLGTANSPHRIYNATQLMDFDKAFGDLNVSCDKHIKLMNDIDLTGKTWTPIGAFSSAGFFKGVIDGNFHTIKGLNITEGSIDGTGIVRGNDADGVIQNLIIDGATISNTEEHCTVGVFVGNTNKGTVKNCHVINSTIATPKGANFIGGLVCTNKEGKLIGCSVINTTITCKEGFGTIGGLACIVENSGVMKGCMFCGKMNVPSGDEGYWGLAIATFSTGSTSTSVYCQNTQTNGTKELWANGTTQGGTKTNCDYVDGTKITWDTAITNMNEAIKSDITEYKYEYDATLDCPKMVKAKK